MVHRLLVKGRCTAVEGIWKKNCPLVSSLPLPSTLCLGFLSSEWCTWWDTALGWAPMCAFGNGRAWQRHLGGKSQCRAPCVLHATFPLCRGEPKIGVVCFSSTRKPKFPFQVDLKVLLIWMGLAMAFLVAGSIWRAADEWVCWKEKWSLGEYVPAQG